ncbi:MAG TPA: monovalent cation/H(+) antiporter subunit G [Bacteroidales bacterium]|nr:monovalent cation/H(+) antiporter subunit G [Bacteroidales bacterium]
MTEGIIGFFLILGTFFVISGSLGMIRFPDVYSRLHAATKSSTLGVAGILIGAFLYFLLDENVVAGKLLLGILFLLLTAPVGGHMISRAAYLRGVSPFTNHIEKDELHEAMIKKINQNKH